VSATIKFNLGFNISSIKMADVKKVETGVLAEKGIEKFQKIGLEKILKLVDAVDIIPSDGIPQSVEVPKELDVTDVIVKKIEDEDEEEVAQKTVADDNKDDVEEMKDHVKEEDEEIDINALKQIENVKPVNTVPAGSSDTEALVEDIVDKREQDKRPSDSNDFPATPAKKAKKRKSANQTANNEGLTPEKKTKLSGDGSANRRKSFNKYYTS